MKTYHDLCRVILDKHGIDPEHQTETIDFREDRTGTGTLSTFAPQMRFDLNKGFPLMTTKKMAFRLIVSELIWFLRGDTNIRYLLEHNNHIWDEWAFERYVQSDDYHGPDMTSFGVRAAKDPAFKKIVDKEIKLFTDRILTDSKFAREYGELGPVYGKQWRSWPDADGGTIDQIKKVIESLKRNPESRRHIVSAWNPAQVDDMALPPCHTMFQFYVEDGRLSCHLYQRSGDVFLGVPFNIASYALLTHIIAKLSGLDVGEFVPTIGDAHIYSNHLDQVKLQLSRMPRGLPTLEMDDFSSLEELTPSMFRVKGYDPHPAIKAPVAV